MLRALIVFLTCEEVFVNLMSLCIHDCMFLWGYCT